MSVIVAGLSQAITACLVFLLRAYQVALSPHLGACCRFEPSCSRYCIEALQTHGVIRGGWLSLGRLGRCRPFGPSGHDPVPPPRPRAPEAEARQKSRAHLALIRTMGTTRP